MQRWLKRGNFLIKCTVSAQTTSRQKRMVRGNKSPALVFDAGSV